MLQAPATKTCRVCEKEFAPRNSMVIVCGLPCARRVPVINRKAEKQALKLRKEAIKTRRDWIKHAQAAFNRFIRLRDQHQRCICCGEPLGQSATGGDYDCGHYRSVGSAPHLRFDERNAHAQNKRCNRYGAGRAVDYRRGLIARIGQDAVEDLEADQSLKKYTIPDLKQIIATYRAKAKELEQ